MQDLSKQRHDKDIKPQNYILSKKVWLNSKYIKIKWNYKLENNFFGLFGVLYPVNNRTYKQKLLEKWKIHNVWYNFFLKQNTTKKEQINKVLEQEQELKFKNMKKHKIELICNGNVYTKKTTDQLPEL